jgi:hypothetical protein
MSMRSMLTPVSRRVLENRRAGWGTDRLPKVRIARRRAEEE